ncbi:MAG: hypothetical protein ACTHMJ_08330 [Thermomicrobiales bacterium]|nr:hypothetical protein [Thermomicrobiales bacterium]
MSDTGKVEKDMAVVGPDERVLGPVEQVHDDGFDVQGLHLPLRDVEQVDDETVHMQPTDRVKLVERRLEVEAEQGVNAPPE